MRAYQIFNVSINTKHQYYLALLCHNSSPVKPHPFIMHLSTIPALCTLLLPIAAQSTSNTTYLTAPALVTINNRTVIQCWRLNTPFLTSSTPGTSGAKAATITNVTNLCTSLPFSFPRLTPVSLTITPNQHTPSSHPGLTADYTQHQPRKSSTSCLEPHTSRSPMTPVKISGSSAVLEACCSRLIPRGRDILLGIRVMRRLWVFLRRLRGTWCRLMLWLKRVGVRECRSLFRVAMVYFLSIGSCVYNRLCISLGLIVLY